MEIGVLGAGVVGMTTANELKNEFPTANVTVIADKFTTETTSDGAAGIFRPGRSFSGPSEEITRKWLKDSYEFYEELSNHEEAPLAGVSALSGYIFSSSEKSIVQNPFLERLVPVYRPVDEEELKLCNGNWKYGSFFRTLCTSCHYFLPWSMERFKRQGGKFKKEEVSRLEDLVKNFDILVNCTGLGAKNLCKDYKVVPIRGQILKVDAPWIKMFFYGDYDTYIIPGPTGLTLGGCRQFDSYNLELSRHDRASIRERCFQMLPSLETAPVLREWVGLRPHRDPVRVEMDYVDAGLKRLKVVHNYGHGGYGVMSAPGTSKYAVQLVRQLHSSKL